MGALRPALAATGFDGAIDPCWRCLAAIPPVVDMRIIAQQSREERIITSIMVGAEGLEV
jgi:hypothetical protein